jgi:acyl dehydratase
MLTLTELSVGMRFRPYIVRCDHALVQAYCSILGLTNPIYVDESAARDATLPGRIVPPGLAAVIARNAYLQDRAMPAGGVLTSHSLTIEKPLLVGEMAVAEAFVIARKQSRGREYVTLRCDIGGGQPASRRMSVELVVMWPPEMQ